MSVLTILNLSAMFDILDHSILLAHLHGIPNKAFEWFSSYFSDNFKSVTVNGWVSAQKKLHDRVPQDSVYGPDLFTLYT